MTLSIDALLPRLRNHEDNLVERKPSKVNASEIRRTLVAFANSVPVGATGVLFIGVHNNGQILGIQNPDELQKTVRHQCEHVCYPPIAFGTVVLHVEDRDVLAITIPESTYRPHFAGAAFIRRGSESVNASRELFDELIYVVTARWPPFWTCDHTSSRSNAFSIDSGAPRMWRIQGRITPASAA